MDEGRNPPGEEGMDSIGALVRESMPAMSAEQKSRGWVRLSMGRRVPWKSAWRVSRFLWVGVSCTAVLAVFIWWFVHPGKTPVSIPASLTFQVDQGAIVDGGYLQARSDNGVVVTFSEGTTLSFARGARGRLRTVDAHGARIAVEQGAADISVVNRSGARWMVDAGPFLIHVQGTVFNVAWDAQEEFLDLRMRQGKVQVTGPISEGAITVRGGQRLSISVPNRAVLIEDADPAPAAESKPSFDPATKPQDRPQAPRARVRPTSIGPFGWGAALAAGDLDGILGEVEKFGLSRCLSAASSEDLAALSDAARYRKKHDISRRALLAQRERFAGSDRSQDAAFHLGRLAEAGQDAGAAAIAWYDRYLSEAPSGSYASEALGRKMTAIAHKDGNAAAIPVAEEYLRRFPQGTYAGAANAIRKKR